VSTTFRRHPCRNLVHRSEDRESIFQMHAQTLAVPSCLVVGLRAKVFPIFAAQPPALSPSKVSRRTHHWAREIGHLGHKAKR
jgi:hypothetical protein